MLAGKGEDRASPSREIAVSPDDDDMTSRFFRKLILCGCASSRTSGHGDDDRSIVVDESTAADDPPKFAELLEAAEVGGHFDLSSIKFIDDEEAEEEDAFHTKNGSRRSIRFCFFYRKVGCHCGGGSRYSPLRDDINNLRAKNYEDNTGSYVCSHGVFAGRVLLLLQQHQQQLQQHLKRVSPRFEGHDR